jgi:hypothetical protein
MPITFSVCLLCLQIYFHLFLTPFLLYTLLGLVVDLVLFRSTQNSEIY